MNTAATQTASVTERFGFILFFATAIHAIAIIGITFSADNYTPPQKTIEITLAQHQQKEAPKEVDFIAQANQTRSGQSLNKHLPTSNQQADFQDLKVNPQAAQQAAIAPAKTEIQSAPIEKKTVSKEQKKPLHTSQVKKKVVTTTQPSQKKIAKKSQKPQTQQPAPATPVGSTSLLARSLEIASLQAEIDNHRQLMAKQPKIRRLTSASTKKREDALYLENWRKKIESIGNLHYPEEARRNKMYGSLRLLVAIKPDGAVKSIEVLESSGQHILDDAAIRIVRLAAPFQPFPVEMRKSTDLLEIIRTWKFEKKAYVY